MTSSRGSGSMSAVPDQLRDEEREVLILTALVHRFSGIAVPAELFAPVLNVSKSSPVELEKLVNASLLDLLAEDEPGAWRMTHSLIAEEILRQLLSPASVCPPGTTGGPRCRRGASG